MSASIVQQLRALADQLDAGAVGRTPLPYSDKPGDAMKLTEDRTHFAEPFWMEGWVGALAGVRLSDWNQTQFTTRWLSPAVPLHYFVLPPNVGQVTISAADLGWIDGRWYDPDNYPDDAACIEAYNKAGRPTVGPRGKFGHLGRYMKGNEHSIMG